MTIEERVQNDAKGFEEALDKKVPEIQAAMKEFAVGLDQIIGTAIAEYCKETGVEMDMNDVSSYKTMNKIITGKLDLIIADFIKEKRKDL